MRIKSLTKIKIPEEFKVSIKNLKDKELEDRRDNIEKKYKALGDKWKTKDKKGKNPNKKL